MEKLSPKPLRLNTEEGVRETQQSQRRGDQEHGTVENDRCPAEVRIACLVHQSSFFFQRGD